MLDIYVKSDKRGSNPRPQAWEESKHYYNYLKHNALHTTAIRMVRFWVRHYPKASFSGTLFPLLCRQ